MRLCLHLPDVIPHGRLLIVCSCRLASQSHLYTSIRRRHARCPEVIEQTHIEIDWSFWLAFVRTNMAATT